MGVSYYDSILPVRELRGDHAGPDHPPGLIAHLADRTESGLRYVEE